MSLLDPLSTNYSVTWDDTSFPNSKGISILEDGKQIGNIKTVGSQILQSKFSLFDEHGSVFLSILQKPGFSDIEYIEDENGSKLGVVHQPILSGEVAEMKDMDDKKILSALGKKILGMSKEQIENYQINDQNKNCIATFSIKTEHFPLEKKKFFKKHDNRCTCFLEILDKEYDRQILVGFFLLVLYHIFSVPYPKGG
jgi:hypothetical protein